MTVRVERSVTVPATPEEVWSFISDPEKRARSISVVTDFELHDDDGTRATWYVELPIPLINRAIRVDTEDEVRNAPEYVRFSGRSKVMNVTGEHRIEPTDDGARLVNTFVVDGRVPGVETFFERNLDREMAHLETELRRDLGIEA